METQFVAGLTDHSIERCSPPQEIMHLRYGLNIGGSWRDLLTSPARDKLARRIREAGTALGRVFLDEGAPAIRHWEEPAAFLDVMQGAGATPMIAFSCPREGSDSAAVRQFARDCGEFAARAADRWGQEVTRSWFWSIGDEPNDPWTNPGYTFERYRDAYEQAAYAIKRRLDASVERPRIGGPCVDGFQPFWFDWMCRFVEEVDDALLGFAAWHWYSEWREPGTWAAPADPDVFERILLFRTCEYWSRAQAVGSLLHERGILNICSELNAHPHPDPAISARFNQGTFGAVYYGSALIELMRGGADGELYWAGACHSGPQCMFGPEGEPGPVYEAKRLIAGNIRFGDLLSFPLDADPDPALDAVLACGTASGRAAVLVHREKGKARFDLARWPALSSFRCAQVLDARTGGAAEHRILGGALEFDGYGLAVLQNSEDR